MTTYLPLQTTKSAKLNHNKKKNVVSKKQLNAHCEALKIAMPGSS